MTGAALLDMGSGDDLLILQSFNGNATLDGGPGIDTICFPTWSEENYESFGKKENIQNFELLLFSEGYKTLNGYTLDNSVTPAGCSGSGYRYPVTVEIMFTSASNAEKDSVADIYNNSSLVELVPDDPAEGDVYLDLYQDNHYLFYLNELSAIEKEVEDDAGNTVTRFVKTLSFDIQSTVQLVESNQIYACSTWSGENNDQLEITMQDTECSL